MARGFIGETFCTQPSSSSSSSLVQPINAAVMVIPSRRWFWCCKDLICCTRSDGKRSEGGKWWSSLGQLVYFWDRTGLGSLLWVWKSSLSSLLMATVALYVPTQHVQRACNCLPSAVSQHSAFSCWWSYVLMRFVRILKHGS